jgi:hypothetical protein
MNRNSGNVFEIGMLGLLLFAVIIILIIGVFSPVSAQDSGITVCRNAQVETVQLEFRNMPLNYFVWNSDAPAWNYWAEGVAMDTEQGILIADPLTVDTDGYAAGTAVLVVYGDAPLTVVGDANSPLCDSTLLNMPKTAEMPIVALNTMPLAQPVVSTGRTCVVQYPQLVVVCGD